MSRLIAKSNKILQFLLRQKGQGLTEFVLILAFCAAIGWGANEVGLMDTIGAVFETSKRPENVTAAIGGVKVDAYAAIFEKYGTDPNGRRALVNLVKEGDKYVLGEDIVPNETRVAADRKALENIADLFLGMNLNTVKKTVFGGEGTLQDNAWYQQGNGVNTKKDGILILSYCDRASVEVNNDPVKTWIGTEGRKFAASEVIHWMQGDYGSYKDPSATYDSTKDYKQGTRYFFSNEMIDMEQYGQSSWDGEKRNIRIRFKVSGTTENDVITGVEVRLQHNGRDYSNLIVAKGDYPTN